MLGTATLRAPAKRPSGAPRIAAMQWLIEIKAFDVDGGVVEDDDAAAGELFERFEHGVVARLEGLAHLRVHAQGDELAGKFCGHLARLGKNLQTDGSRRLHESRAAAIGAGLAQRALERLPHALAR